MAFKAIKMFDVGSGAWRELAVILSNKAGFFPVDQMREAAVLLDSVESWLKGRTFPKLCHLTLEDCSQQPLKGLSRCIAE